MGTVFAYDEVYYMHMAIASLLIMGLFGAVVGSFLNVVILRLNTGRSLHGRSSCASCGRTLSTGELIPILSYLFLGGRCKHCRSLISPQYVLVEALTAALFVLLSLHAQGIEFAFMVVIACITIVILGYDLKHMIIPDALVYTLVALGVIQLALSNPTLLDIATGPLIFTFFYVLWRFSKGTWVGLGDGKLGLAIGFLLGSGAYSAFVIAFWVGTVWALSLIASQYIVRTTHLSRTSKPLTIKSEVPFAPFLIVGFWLVYLYEIDVVALVALFIS